MRTPAWLVFLAVAALGVLIAIVAVAWREPVPNRGTAPSVITGSTTDPAQAPSTSAVPPREVDSSASAARAARGSGIEGVPSSGITTEPPSGR